MGAGLEAVQDPIGRRVAIKILHPKYAQDPGHLRTLFSTKPGRQPSSTILGVVQISDYGQFPDGTAYLVMEYLRGETLSQRQKSKGMPPLPEIMRLASADRSGTERSARKERLSPRPKLVTTSCWCPTTTRGAGSRAGRCSTSVSRKWRRATSWFTALAQPKTSTDVCDGHAALHGARAVQRRRPNR